MSFNQLAPTVPTILNCSNCFVYSNSSSGNALSVQQLGAGNCLSVSNASGVVGLFVSSLGRVGIGQTNPQATFHSIVNPVTNGFDAILGQMIVKSYSLSLSTTVGAYSNICTIATQLGAFAVDLDIVCDQNNQTSAKSYRAAFAYGGAASGWTTLGAISTGYGQNPFEVDIYNAVSQISYTFRLRRINGTVTGPFLCTFRIYYGPNASGITITDTPSPATGTGATSIGVYTGTPIYTLNGNVGIGTTSPSCKFNVDNGTGTGLNSFIQASGITAGGTTGFLLGKALSTNNCATMNWNHVGDGLGTNYLGIGAYANDSKLNITAAGNVGIGTTNPAYVLDVLGMARVNSGTSNVLIGGGQSAGQGGLYILPTSSISGASWKIGCGLQGSYSNAISFDSGCNVGIGITNPSYPLHVATNATLPSQSIRYFTLATALTTAAFPVTTSIYAASSIVTSDAFAAISDRRAKVLEESPSESYMDLVDKIQVHQYSWIDKVEKGSRKRIGFFAQEVEEVVPDAVGHTTAVVPTIYREANAFTETTVTVKGHGLTTEKKLEVVDPENGKTKIEIVRVIDADNLEVKFEKVPKEKLFVVGPEVDDSRMVNHDYLMAVGFGGLKELHALVKTQQTTIEMLTERLAALEGTIGSRVGA